MYLINTSIPILLSLRTYTKYYHFYFKDIYQANYSFLTLFENWKKIKDHKNFNPMWRKKPPIGINFVTL